MLTENASFITPPDLVRLTMAADKVRFQLQSFLRSENGLGIKITEKKVEPGEIRHARSRRIH